MDVAKLAAYLLGTRRRSRRDLGRRQGARASACRWRWCRPPPGPARKRPPSRSSPSAAAIKLAVNSPAADRRLGGARRRADHRPAAPCHRRDRHRRDGPCDRGLYLGAAQEPDVGHAGARGAAAAVRQSADAPASEPGDLDARSAMLLGAHLAGVAFANAPVAGVHALAYPLGGHFHVPHGLSNALMLRPGARPQHARRRASFMPSWRRSSIRLRSGRAARRAGAGLRSTGSPAGRGRAACRRACAIMASAREHLDLLARGGDEAGAAAGEQSLPDRAKPTRGGFTRRRCEPPEPRWGGMPIAVWREIATRWADNDAYGHVNNTVYYAWFDTAVNAWLIEAGLLDIAARRSDRPRRRNRLPLFRAA